MLVTSTIKRTPGVLMGSKPRITTGCMILSIQIKIVSMNSRRKDTFSTRNVVPCSHLIEDTKNSILRLRQAMVAQETTSDSNPLISPVVELIVPLGMDAPIKRAHTSKQGRPDPEKCHGTDDPEKCHGTDDPEK